MRPRRNASSGVRLPAAGCRLSAVGSKFLYVFKAALDGPHAPPPGRAPAAAAVALRPSRLTPGGRRGKREARGRRRRDSGKGGGGSSPQPAAPRLSSAAQERACRVRAASPKHGGGGRGGHAGRPGAGSAAAQGQVNCSPGTGRVAAGGHPPTPGTGARLGQLRHCGGVRWGAVRDTRAHSVRSGSVRPCVKARLTSRTGRRPAPQESGSTADGKDGSRSGGSGHAVR